MAGSSRGHKIITMNDRRRPAGTPESRTLLGTMTNNNNIRFHDLLNNIIRRHKGRPNDFRPFNATDDAGKMANGEKRTSIPLNFPEFPTYK